MVSKKEKRERTIEQILAEHRVRIEFLLADLLADLQLDVDESLLQLEDDAAGPD